MPVPTAALLCSMLGCLLHTLSSADLPFEESGAASTLMPSKEPIRDFSSQLGMRPTAGCAAPDHAATSVLIEPPGYHIAKAGAPGRTGLHEREPPRGEPCGAHLGEPSVLGRQLVHLQELPLQLCQQLVPAEPQLRDLQIPHIVILCHNHFGKVTKHTPECDTVQHAGMCRGGPIALTAHRTFTFCGPAVHLGLQ